MPDFALKSAVSLAARLCPPGAHRDQGPAGDRLCPLRAGAGRNRTISPALRYFNDTQMARLPTQLAKAQLAAALALYGDAARAAVAYNAAPRTGRRRRPRPALCRLRQRAARQRRARWPLPPAIPAIQPRLTAVDGPDRRAVRPRPPDQHAGAGLAADGGRGRGEGQRRRDDRRRRRRARRKPAASRSICAVRSGSGAAPLTRGQSRRRARLAHGVDHRRAEGRSAGREQRLCRRPLRSTGRTARGRSQQGAADRLFVVVINGTSDRRRRKRHGPCVVDLLPAGFEIETATVAKGRAAGDYGWLPALTDAAYAEERDDRFVAALDLGARRRRLHARLCRARGDPGRVRVSGRSSSRTCTTRRPPAAPRSAVTAALSRGAVVAIIDPPPPAGEGDCRSARSAAGGRASRCGRVASLVACAVAISSDWPPPARSNAAARLRACRCWCWRATARCCAAF